MQRHYKRSLTSTEKQGPYWHTQKQVSTRRITQKEVQLQPAHDGTRWLASQLGHVNTKEKDSQTVWLERSVNPTAGLNVMAKEKIHSYGESKHISLKM